MIYSATFPVILLLLADVSSLTSAASQTCSSKVLTDDERLLILEEHNSRRSRLAKGLEKTAKWTAPQASEMYKMVYDCQLEKWAQKHADRCYFKHSEDRHDVGENIYKSTDTKSSTPIIHVGGGSCKGIGAFKRYKSNARRKDGQASLSPLIFD
uniref:SCP domain-containing protein n=1 Tax=Parascaris univalens TaxID=6257 RepID=A0A914ZYT2_PARUN